MLELLAPAGSMEALRAAVQNGASAVYLGCGAFNARQSAKNFTPQTLVEAIKYCHVRGVQVHLTLNTLVSDREMTEAGELIRHAAQNNIDAFIVQDLGVVQLCRQIAPGVPIHGSTQMTVHSLPGVLLCAAMGMKRVVLSRELSREEYERLVRTAREKGQKSLALLLEAICSTGIRVSEVRFLTVEAAKRGRAEISLKGKSRVILLPERLCKRLLSYAAKRGVRRGEVFLSKTGRSLDRRRIWREMKALCPLAGVRAEKVFPHNLRHLFSRVFYEITRDISKLSDVLGHSSMETTRVYLISAGAEHRRALERMRLIL